MYTALIQDYLLAKPDAKPHITRRQAENVRAAIKVGNIVNRLQKAAMGEIDVTPTQLNAAKVLLDKCLPNLTATEITEQVPEQSLEELEERLRQMIAQNPKLLELIEPLKHQTLAVDFKKETGR